MDATSGARMSNPVEAPFSYSHCYVYPFRFTSSDYVIGIFKPFFFAHERQLQAASKLQ
jgi:hypothetical protein